MQINIRYINSTRGTSFPSVTVNTQIYSETEGSNPCKSHAHTRNFLLSLSHTQWHIYIHVHTHTHALSLSNKVPFTNAQSPCLTCRHNLHKHGMHTQFKTKDSFEFYWGCYCISTKYFHINYIIPVQNVECVYWRLHSSLAWTASDHELCCQPWRSPLAQRVWSVARWAQHCQCPPSVQTVFCDLLLVPHVLHNQAKPMCLWLWVGQHLSAALVIWQHRQLRC